MPFEIPKFQKQTDRLVCRFLSDRNSRNPATAQPHIQSGVVPTPQSQQKESELVWRRAKNQSNFPVKPGHTTANGNQVIFLK